MLGKGYKAIIFDFDGTLYNRNGINKKMIMANLFYWRYLKGLKEVREEMAGKDYGSKEAFYSAFYAAVAKKTKKKIYNVKKWYTNTFYSKFVKVLADHFYSRPKVNKLLYNLQTRGYRLAVVSDYDKIAERMQALGIDQNPFRCLLSAEAVGALKPHPKSLLAAADVLGTKPAATLVIGDRSETDGQAARNAGMGYIEIIEQFLEKTDKYVWRDFYQKIIDHQ
ncbi:MAG TPA: HAD family hydrolase [Spirochaetota bacterium]|nr:HAD family hydrolase [Spirochaetota bacterium]